MMRMKSIFAVLVLAAIVGVVPQVQAQNFVTVIAGSSALFNSLALGAYNNGASQPLIGSTGPTYHWTSASNKVNLVDNRTTVPNTDAGTIWVVWDSTATPNVWVFDKVDSVVGNRCYFAAPKCTMSGPASVFSAAGAGQVSSALWGADTALPPSIQSVLASGTLTVNVAATDIRPEDAAFAACRVNSALGASKQGGVASDGLDGLGYNANNASGVCAVFASGTAQAKGLGSPILSGYPASTGQANVLAFNLTGYDPISNTKLPTTYTVTAVGAAPIVFVASKANSLAALSNATEQQLQQVFSGNVCDASAFGSAFSGGINIFLREPLSGTYNTTEATVMRYPTVYPNPVMGISMETNVNGAVNNPLDGQAGTCVSNPSGTGARYRAIGTSEEVKSVLNSNAASTFTTQQDGIGFTFFSYGNVGSIANNSSYGYIQLNGVDPIFASYYGATGVTPIDPGQPAGPGELPGAANLPATCAGGAGSFPCNEAKIWGNGFSFPNLRNGTYRAWSLLRLVATGAPSTAAADLVKASNQFVVTSIPDYVPATAVAGTTDLGLKLVRSHYQQEDGNGVKLGKAATNVPESGGDMGGMIIPSTIGVTTEKQIQMVQSSNPADGSLGPVYRKVN